MLTIKQLYEDNKLCTRSYRICMKYGIENLPQLMSFYKTRGSFLNLRSCGVIINNELSGLCEYYSSIIELDPDNPDKPIRYADLESGQNALKRGHIAVLIVLDNKSQLEKGKLSELGESVGWCLI